MLLYIITFLEMNLLLICKTHELAKKQLFSPHRVVLKTCICFLSSPFGNFNEGRVRSFTHVILSGPTGSLWDPNITACKKDEKTVEVNFTTSPLGNRYMAVIQTETAIGFSVLEVLFPFIPYHHPVLSPSLPYLLKNNADTLGFLSFERPRGGLSPVQVGWVSPTDSIDENKSLGLPWKCPCEPKLQPR